jgi:hypothetical protein
VTTIATEALLKGEIRPEDFENVDISIATKNGSRIEKMDKRRVESTLHELLQKGALQQNTSPDGDVSYSFNRSKFGKSAEIPGIPGIKLTGVQVKVTKRA